MESQKVVLLDDDLVIREALTILLSSIGKSLSTDIKTYCSDSGVEGVGYVFIINPDIVIIDTTLPKYSGRELIDYLRTNLKFNTKLVFVLHDGTVPIGSVPGNYVVLSKKDKNFIDDLTSLIEKYLVSRNKDLKEESNIEKSILAGKLPGLKIDVLGTKKLVIQETLSWANRADFFSFKINEMKKNPQKGFVAWITWLIKLLPLYFAKVFSRINAGILLNFLKFTNRREDLVSV